MAELGETKRKVAEFESKGDYKNAIIELEKAVQEFPNDGTLFNRLGDLYIKTNQQAKALDIYEKGVRVFKEETFFPNAIALCKKILRLDKERTEIYGLLGGLHKELDQRGEAASYLLEYADRKLGANELEAALKAYDTIKELVPNNPKILETISAIYEKLGKKEEGVELLKEAKEIEVKQERIKETLIPTSEEEKVTVKEEKIEEVKAAAPKPKEEIPLEEFVSPEVAELLKDTKKTPAAEEAVAEEEVGGQLSEIDKTVELGELYLNLGSEEEAVDCFRTAAEQALSQEKIDQALTLNKKIAQLRPFDLKSRQHLIEIAKIKGDTQMQINSMLELAEALTRRDARSEAQSLYKKVLELDPENPVASQMVVKAEKSKEFIDLGEILRSELSGEKKDEGLQTIDGLVSEFRREVFESIGEGDYRSHYDLGVAYKEMGLYQEAIEEFEFATKDESIKLKAYEMIGACLLEKGKIEDALRTLDNSLKITGRPGREYFGIYFLMAHCYEAQGNLTKALKAYMNAYNLDKTVPELTKKITTLRDKVAEELRKRGKKATPDREEKPAEVKKSKIVPKKSKITYL